MPAAPVLIPVTPHQQYGEAPVTRDEHDEEQSAPDTDRKRKIDPGMPTWFWKDPQNEYRAVESRRRQENVPCKLARLGRAEQDNDNACGQHDDEANADGVAGMQRVIE